MKLLRFNSRAIRNTHYNRFCLTPMSLEAECRKREPADESIMIT